MITGIRRDKINSNFFILNGFRLINWEIEYLAAEILQWTDRIIKIVNFRRFCMKLKMGFYIFIRSIYELLKACL